MGKFVRSCKTCTVLSVGRLCQLGAHKPVRHMTEKLVNQISTVKRFYVRRSTSIALHPEVTVEENVAHHHLFLTGSE